MIRRQTSQDMDWTFRTLSQTVTQRSRLLELPAEIRTAIFEFALSLEKPVVAFLLDDYQRDRYEEATQPALLRASRQLRQECLPIFYDCNDIVLHTEGSKAEDTCRWLQCIEPELPKLRRVSLWLRYVTLTNDRSASNGALSVSLQRSRPTGVWSVNGEWKWITVTRKPSGIESDGKILIDALKRTLAEDDNDWDVNAEGFIGVMMDLKMSYIKEKMS